MSSRRYPIPAGFLRQEQEIKASRFITSVDYAPTEDRARDFVNRIRNEFPDANHNCWAFVVGPPGNTQCNGASDDGEPGGTAGRPMLSVLLGAEIGDVVAVVTRYFGGVKLGTGGLVRAYSGGVRAALRTLARTTHVPRTRVEIAVSYSLVASIERELPRHEANVEHADYGATPRLTVSVPLDRTKELKAALVELTNGAIQLSETIEGAE